MSFIGSLPVSSFLKFPLNNASPNTDYLVEQWNATPWDARGGDWSPVLASYTGTGALYTVNSSLMVPGQYLSLPFPFIDFSQTLCLRIAKQSVYSYIWYDASALLPQVWLLQPSFGNQAGATGTQGKASVNFMGEQAVNHGNYCYIESLDAFDEKPKSVDSLEVFNSYGDPIKVHYLNRENELKSLEIESQSSSIITEIDIPVTDLAPGMPFNPFFIQVMTQYENTEISKTTFSKGIIYDENGDPYIAQAIPVAGDAGFALRLKFVSDGHILVIGTMDLDPLF